MKAKSKIRVGMLGVGRAGGGMQCNELEKRQDKFEVSALCDISESQMEPYSKKFSCKTYTDMQKLLADKDIDIISITTRSNDHVKHAIMALKTGKHVFLEKPIALTYADALKLQKAAAKAKGKLFLRHNRRFEPAFQHIMEIIKEGILGKVYEVKLRRLGYSRRCDWQTLREFGGGQLNNWGPHLLDHSLSFLGSPVSEIWSDIRQVASAGDAEDHLKIVLKGKSGIIVDLEISGGAAISEPQYIIFGTKGALTCDEKNITLRYLDPKVKLKPVKADRKTPNGFGSGEQLPWIEKTIPVAPALKVDMDSIWDYIYDTLVNKKRFPITLERGVEIVRICEIVRKNARK